MHVTFVQLDSFVSAIGIISLPCLEDEDAAYWSRDPIVYTGISWL